MGSFDDPSTHSTDADHYARETDARLKTALRTVETFRKCIADERATVTQLRGELSDAHEQAEGYRVNAESDVKNLRDLLRRSFVNGCKLSHLQDDSIAADVYEALGVADQPIPLMTLALQLDAQEAKDAQS